MRVFHFAMTYFFWHYSRALFNIVTIWKNFMWFTYHFFSIPTLTRTLLSPWRRLSEEYSSDGFDIEEYAAAFAVNFMMRLLGAVMRTGVIIIGIIALILLFVFGVVFTAVWLLMPLVIAGAFVVSTTYIL